MRHANYDKFPATKISGAVVQGWESIICELKRATGGKRALAIELYTGTYEEEIAAAFSGFSAEIIHTRDLMVPEEEVRAYITEKFADVVATKNKGQIMKAVMAQLKGKADGKVINQVVADLCR